MAETPIGHDERAPLLQPNGIPRTPSPPPAAPRGTRTLASGLTLLFIISVIFGVWFIGDDTERYHWPPWASDPASVVDRVLRATPVIDGHIDLPEKMRGVYRNNITAVNLREPMPGHVDIPRLRRGHAGAFFWSTWVACPSDAGYTDNANFTVPSYRVRDTLEQIDVTKLVMEQYPDTFELARNSYDAEKIMASGKIAGWIGVEGGHQIGNSLAVLRQYHELGVRYITLTHSCSNAIGDTAGILETPEPVHGGLSAFGKDVVLEMNRLGILVDLSHTADSTAYQALNLSRAPVIWSHSSARAVHDVPRNVPDEMLKLIGFGKGQKDAVVMVNFAPYFIAPPGEATVKKVADHVEHIAKVAGKAHVGIGSDFDGIGSTPVGLEDVSAYPNLFVELYKRGWTKRELAGLAAGNLLRVFRGADAVSRQLKAEPPSMAVYAGRLDLPPASERGTLTDATP